MFSFGRESKYRWAIQREALSRLLLCDSIAWNDIEWWSEVMLPFMLSNTDWIVFVTTPMLAPSIPLTVRSNPLRPQCYLTRLWKTPSLELSGTLQPEPMWVWRGCYGRYALDLTLSERPPITADEVRRAWLIYLSPTNETGGAMESTCHEPSQIVQREKVLEPSCFNKSACVHPNNSL